MTTFTTEDRIIAEQNGSVTINVEPIPFAGWVNTSPPHIVDSGASVMNNDQLYFYNRGFNDCLAKGLNPVKELTDDEIADLIKATNDEIGFRHIRIFDFVKVLLRKAQDVT